MFKKFLVFSILVTFLTTSFSLPVLAAETLLDSELEADIIASPTPTDTVNFVLDARWGFVRGNPDKDKTEKIYDGSIYSTSLTNSKISLNSKLLFERNDSIVEKTNPVSWTSKIYGHWDGVRVNIRSKVSESITIKTAKGEVTKTAGEWFALTEPAVQDFGNNEMLVIKTHRNDNRRHGILIWWGRKTPVNTTCPDTPTPESQNSSEVCVLPVVPSVNFSGNLKMDLGSLVKLKRVLRFESNDKIISQDRTQITWESTIANSRDGLYTFMLPHRDYSSSSGFTITLNNIQGDIGGWKRHYTFDELKNGVRDTIHIGGAEYVIAVGHKKITNQLVRAKNSRRMFVIKDNIKHPAKDLDILHENGYNETEAVDIDDDELEIFSEGDDLEYPNGTVVDDDTNSYLLSNGVKRKVIGGKITNLISRRLFGVKLGGERIDAIQEGAPIEINTEYTDDILVTTENDTAVWRIRGDKRQVFTHARIFDLHKLNWSRIRKITQEKLQSFNWAPPVEFPNNSLVKIPTDPKVYLLENGIRRWIESEEDLKGLGYKFSQIVDMSPTEITNYPEGDPVIADDPENASSF